MRIVEEVFLLEPVVHFGEELVEALGDEASLDNVIRSNLQKDYLL